MGIDLGNTPCTDLKLKSFFCNTSGILQFAKPQDLSASLLSTISGSSPCYAFSRRFIEWNGFLISANIRSLFSCLFHHWHKRCRMWWVIRGSWMTRTVFPCRGAWRWRLRSMMPRPAVMRSGQKHGPGRTVKSRCRRLPDAYGFEIRAVSLFLLCGRSVWACAYSCGAQQQNCKILAWSCQVAK